MKLMRSKLFWFTLALVVISLALTLTAAITGKPTFLRGVAGAVITPLQRAASATADWVSDLFGYFYRYDALERENQALKDRIQQLERLEITYQEAISQNAALREAAGIKARRSDFDLEPCSVVSVTGSGFQSALTLNRGSLSGIEAGDCVITKNGMVGFVAQVGLNDCVVKTVINADFTASALISRTREVVVTNGSFELAANGLFKVSYLENDADIRPGDVIVTSGGAYPPNLILGRVESFQLESHGISSYASVTPAVDFSELSSVLVVKDFVIEN